MRHNIFYRMLARQKALDLLTLGEVENSFAWTICPKEMGKNSIVVSAGAGRDISFELQLIHRFGCRVILLDPSPTGIHTMSLRRNQHPNLIFWTQALVREDGSVGLAQPGNKDEGSFSCRNGGGNGPKVEGISLATLMKREKLKRVDLLKMDIEGSEYGVIESLLAENIRVRQICVEYHNQVLPWIKTSWTAGSLLRLWLAGWRIIHKSGSNHTLWNDRF